MKLKIYADGAPRGNPGPSAIAFMILIEEENYLLEKRSGYVGIRTNNQAEYEALISALNCAINFSSQAACYSDSALVVNQINGRIKIIDAKMRRLWRKLVGIKERFHRISFHHVPRTNEYIKEVDRLANQELDKIMRKQEDTIEATKPRKTTKQTTLCKKRGK